MLFRASLFHNQKAPSDSHYSNLISHLLNSNLRISTSTHHHDHHQPVQAGKAYLKATRVQESKSPNRRPSQKKEKKTGKKKKKKRCTEAVILHTTHYRISPRADTLCPSNQLPSTQALFYQVRPPTTAKVHYMHKHPKAGCVNASMRTFCRFACQPPPPVLPSWNLHRHSTMCRTPNVIPFRLTPSVA